ncbi:MAG TPA: NAD(P)H-hydrate dehydratase, partial [Candidatus Sulfotelmatobacter sp.]|nr:NAD(P)H-hydrate dehydratase [Candidatus Sulfotelmatobacter sp.]
AELVNFANLFTPDVIVIPHQKIKDLRADVIAIGPGCGVNNNTRNILFSLLAGKKPLVIDADALTLLAREKKLAAALHAGVILTPHPGEMAKLTGQSAAEVQKDRQRIAKRTAAGLGVTLILKGDKTVVTDPQGRVFINQTGNPGMGTAGSGDVLTGMLAGLVGQCHDGWAAAKVGVYLHGLAGDLAARAKSEPGLIASDIVDHIPDAIIRNA